MRPALACLLALLAVTPGRAAAREQVVVLATRRNVRQAYLLCTEGEAPPAAVAVLFPGSMGKVGLPEDGSAPNLNPKGNFLVRSRLALCTADLAVALVDAPSDQGNGMTDAFRAGDGHLQDLEAILRDLRARWPQVRLVLVGASRGTLSVAYLARSLGDRIQGAVLTSAVYADTKQNAGLERFDFRKVTAPLLVVHHAEDACSACPYGRARRLGETRDLITVRGGAPDESGPCDPLSAHGFFGREAATAAAIRAWILGRPFPRTIE